MGWGCRIGLFFFVSCYWSSSIRSNAIKNWLHMQDPNWEKSICTYSLNKIHAFILWNRSASIQEPVKHLLWLQFWDSSRVSELESETPSPPALQQAQHCARRPPGHSCLPLTDSPPAHSHDTEVGCRTNESKSLLKYLQTSLSTALKVVSYQQVWPAVR